MRLLGRLSHPRRPLAALVPAVLIATLTVGCGDSGERVQQDPDPDNLPDSSGSSDTSDTGPPETVEILSGVATGGSTKRGAVELVPGSRDAVADLTRELTRPELAREVRQVISETEVPEGRKLVGAVVSIGCDVPSDIKVSVGDSGIELEPVWTGVEKLQECFAPVTSIGIVMVDLQLGAGYM